MSTSLRACDAYEAFVRTYKGLETERGAAEFLLLDRLFPRWTKVPYNSTTTVASSSLRDLWA